MNSFKHSLTYSIAAVIIAIAISLGLYAIDQVESPLRFLTVVGFLVMLILGLKAWRDKEKSGVLSYGQAFGYSTLVTLVFSLLVAIWTYMFMQYIAHDEFVRIQAERMAKSADEMRDKYGMSEAQIEKSMEMGRRFSGPGFISVIFFFMNMIGLTIVNLIVAAIMKKDPPPPAPAAYPPTNTFSA